MIISFGWTAPSLIANAKTSTLREWDHLYATRFKQGQLVQAWDRSPRAHGRKIADLRLTADPEWIHVRDLAEAAEANWIGEGFAYFHAHPLERPKTIWKHTATGIDFSIGWFREWIHENPDLGFYLVRFRIESFAP